MSNVFAPDVTAVWRKCARVLWPIGGQLAAGFQLAGLFHGDDVATPLNRYMPTSMATMAIRMV